MDASAQWNAIAGYDVMHPDITQFNHLMRRFNEKYPQTEKALGKINFLHGMIVGLRYQYDLGAVELAYRRSMTRNRSERILGYRSQGRTLKVDELSLNYDLAAWSFTFEWGRSFIAGISLDYFTFKQKIKYDGDGDVLRNYKDSQHTWGHRIFVGAHLANTQHISFSVRPYYQWYWSATNLNNLYTEILSEECISCLEQPHSFGVSIIINNGPQR